MRTNTLSTGVSSSRAAGTHAPACAMMAARHTCRRRASAAGRAGLAARTHGAEGDPCRGAPGAAAWTCLPCWGLRVRAGRQHAPAGRPGRGAAAAAPRTSEQDERRLAAAELDVVGDKGARRRRVAQRLRRKHLRPRSLLRRAGRNAARRDGACLPWAAAAARPTCSVSGRATISGRQTGPCAAPSCAATARLPSASSSAACLAAASHSSCWAAKISSWSWRGGRRPPLRFPARAAQASRVRAGAGPRLQDGGERALAVQARVGQRAGELLLARAAVPLEALPRAGQLKVGGDARCRLPGRRRRRPQGARDGAQVSSAYGLHERQERWWQSRLGRPAQQRACALACGGRAAHLRYLQQVALLLNGHKGDSRAQAAAHVRRILREPGLRRHNGLLRGVKYVVYALRAPEVSLAGGRLNRLGERRRNGPHGPGEGGGVQARCGGGAPAAA